MKAINTPRDFVSPSSTARAKVISFPQYPLLCIYFFFTFYIFKISLQRRNSQGYNFNNRAILVAVITIKAA